MSFINFLLRPWLRPEPKPARQPTESIAAIAAGDENFEILVAALGAAGLVDTFAGAGDFTVFAPTDEAFRELASTTLGLDIDGLSDAEVAGALVSALGVDTLSTVLFYHVKSGASSVAALEKAGTVTTLQADDNFATMFAVEDGELVDADPEVENPEFIDGLTDIRATNGVIQAIDRVLLPLDLEEATPQPTIADVAAGDDAFEALVAALVATDLVGVVADREADFTVFAPTDDAFRNLAVSVGVDVEGVADADLAGALVGALGAELVTDVLLYHVAPGGSSLDELNKAKVVETALGGASVSIDGREIIDADPQIDNPTVIEGLADIEAANGVIQAIDAVLLPLDLEPVEPLFLVGTRSGDILQGGAANDKLFGRKGHDVLEGGAGKDLLIGGWGRDKLDGGAGDDVLRGGVGRDYLKGGEGDDFLVGGRQRDTFDFTSFEGHDVVRDFWFNDRLLVSNDDFADVHAVLDAAEVTHRGTVIETADGSVLLKGFYRLDENDILFT